MFVLYHCTKRENVSSILSEGLLTRYASCWKHSKKKPIYLSNEPFNGFGESCFKVTCPETVELSRLSDWEYLCWDDISPEYLEYMGEKEK